MNTTTNEKVRAALTSGNASEAEALCQAALRTTPDDKFLLGSLAEALLFQKRTESAVETLEQAERHHPGSPGLAALLVKALMKLGRYDQAIPRLERLIGVQPSAALYAQLADLYELTGNPERGLDALARAIQDQPRDPYLRLRRGLAAFNRNKMDVAEAELRIAMDLAPTNASISYNLGFVLQSCNRNEEAMACFDTAITQNPAFADAHHAKGMLLLKSGQADAALSAFHHAQKRAPTAAQHDLAIALALKDAGRGQEAIDQLQQLLRAHPTHVEARHLLGVWTGTAHTDLDKAYVETLFDGYASKFDRHLVSELGYAGPQVMADMLTSLNLTQASFDNVIDIGCGTGLGLAALKKSFAVRKAIGIDLSQQMLERAATKSLYTQLIRGDAVEVLATLASPADLVAALEVLVYIGDLRPIMSAVARITSPGGHFVCSVETINSGQFALQDSMRFGHGVSYVEDLAATMGFVAVRSLARGLRKHAGQTIPGHIWVFHKAA